MAVRAVRKGLGPRREILESDLEALGRQRDFPLWIFISRVKAKPEAKSSL